MNKNIVGDNLRKIRESMNLTQEELALRAGLTQGYINFLESGKRGYTKKSLEKISKSLGVPIYKLFDEEVKKTPTGVAEPSKKYRRHKPYYDEIIGLLDKLPDSVIDHYRLLLKTEIEIRSRGQ
ncbi:MAG: immunity repressor protein [Candidatus Scalindua rubra]|uniref:Immunity repressor protein n=1 Tax=Candidatus Scalindua rubra TaxID=1872076 RepID=A0A1E3X2R6_9BACT|nr:MAG: immunity repressor protein [Candidatus Scalindua rubra]